MHPPEKKRVLIADDHGLVAEGLVRLLNPEFQTIGVSYNGRSLLSDAVELRPDLIVLDVSMPELNGIEAAKILSKALPPSKLIFVSQHIDPRYVRAAFSAGAVGYVAKNAASEELIMALRQALAGGTYISPMLQEKLAFEPIVELRKHTSKQENELTSRQRQVLQLIAEGKTTREIAASLGISAKTVEFHKKAIMDQTALRTTAELTRYALANGIVSM
jgi:DNA-binding NarL/FixJ family response regulator